MILYADKLVDLRRRGVGFPSVWFYVGDYAPDRSDTRYPWWQHKTAPHVYLKAPNAYEDLRPFVGLHVYVTVESYSEAVAVFFTRLCEYARSAHLLVDSWGYTPDSVIYFDKKNGQTTLEALGHG